MKINEMVKIGDQVEQRTREMTAEEVAEMMASQHEVNLEPTVEERLSAVEAELLVR